MTTKKSQMEIMGLAVIVILIVIGFSFMVKFMAQKKPVEYKEEYSRAELVTNIINTMLKTTATLQGNCKGMSFSDLLAKCSEASSFTCEDPPPQTKGVCDFVKEKMEGILKKTIGKEPNALRLDYYMAVSKDLKGNTKLTLSTRDPFVIKNIADQCPGAKKSSTYPLPTSGAGNIYIKLDICG